MGTIYILRGLPGSGKSTYAARRWPGLTPAKLAPEGWGHVVVSADHYFTNLYGEYTFVPEELPQAHQECRLNLLRAVVARVPVVVVDNTHTRLWEFAETLEIAKIFGYEVSVVSIFDGGCTDDELAERNSHGVPLEEIKKFRAKWERYEGETWVPGA